MAEKREEQLKEITERLEQGVKTWESYQAVEPVREKNTEQDYLNAFQQQPGSLCHLSDQG